MDLTMLCREVIEQLALPALVLDPGATILSANPPAERLLGRAEEPLAGRSWAEACDIAGLPPDFRDRVARAVTEGGSLREKATAAKDGVEVLLITVSPLLKEGVHAGALVLLDPIPSHPVEGEPTARLAHHAELSLRLVREAEPDGNPPGSQPPVATSQLEWQVKALDAILSATVDHILVADRSHRFTYANTSALEALGLGWDDVVGKTWREVPLPAEFMGPVAEQAETVFETGRPLTHRSSFPVADGLREFEYTLMPVYDPTGEVEAIVATIRDVTDRKRMEERLAESEAGYRALVEEQTEFVTRLAPNGRVLFVNEACCRAFGLTREQFAEIDMYALVPDEDREAVREQLSLLGVRRPVVDIEHRLIAAGGERRWVHWTNRAVFDGEGRLIETRGVGRDVTDRHRAEEALRASEAHFRTVFENAVIGMALTAPDGTLSHVNTAFADMLGYTPEELAAMDFVAVTHPDDVEASRECVRRLLAGEADTYRFEKRYVRRGGEVTWAEVSTSLLRDASGTPLHFVTFVHDITNRTRMERELRESEHRYRSLFDELPVSVWEEDFSETKRELDGLRSVGVGDLGAYLEANPQEIPRLLATVRIRDVNDYTWRLHGASSKDHLLAEHGRLVDERGYRLFGEQLVALVNGHRSLEVRDTYRTLAGGSVHLAGRLFVPQGHGETLDRVIVVLVDITERKQAEEALRESEARYRGVVDNIGIGIAVISPGLEVLSANPQMEAWFPGLADGGSPLCYRVFNDPPGDGPCWYCPTIRTLRDGLVHEAFTDTPSGSGIRHYRVIASPLRDASGEVVAAIEMVEDCTERVEEEKALRESEERFRDLVDRSPLGIVIHREGTLLYVNPAELRLLGYDDPSEVLETSIVDHIAAEHRAKVVQRFAESRGDVERVYETTVVRRDGSEVPVLIQAIDSTFPYGRVSVAFFLDLTDRRRAEQAQRLAAVGHLAAGVAHEFNNLLAGILMQADQADRTGSGSAYRLLATLVRDAATRGSALCDDLLEFARPREPKWEPVRIEAAIEAALAVAAHHIEDAGVTVTRRFHSEEGLVTGDVGRLQQVFLNLILNGCEAMPDGGELTFETDCSATEGGGSAIVVTVTDTGTGIEAESLSHIFEPFFTTKGVRGEGGGRGTGLGLSLSHSVVVGHGGTVSVKSSSGAGTTFELRFPAHEGEVATAVPEVTSDEGPRPLSLHGRRVLLVEDESLTRMVLRRTLELEGCELATACSVAEATEALRTGTFDVVVCDWLMPQGGGRQVIEAARGLPTTPAIVVITGFGGEGFEDELASLGVEKYLRKPFGEDALLSAVWEATGGR